MGAIADLNFDFQRLLDPPTGVTVSIARDRTTGGFDIRACKWDGWGYHTRSVDVTEHELRMAGSERAARALLLERAQLAIAYLCPPSIVFRIGTRSRWHLQTAKRYKVGPHKRQPLCAAKGRP